LLLACGCGGILLRRLLARQQNETLLARYGVWLAAPAPPRTARLARRQRAYAVSAYHPVYRRGDWTGLCCAPGVLVTRPAGEQVKQAASLQSEEA